MQLLAKNPLCGSLRDRLFPKERAMSLPYAVPRRLHIYDSTLCLSCIAYIGKGFPEEDAFPPQIIPINPEMYVSYFCTSCFADLPIGEVIRETRAYISTEKEVCEKLRKSWRTGIPANDPLQFLEHSISFLRGYEKDPPFHCAIFTLHRQRIKGCSRIIHRDHLALISFT